jgi:hypothetical protein
LPRIARAKSFAIAKRQVTVRIGSAGAGNWGGAIEHNSKFAARYETETYAQIDYQRSIDFFLSPIL